VVDRRRKDASAAALTGPVVTSATAAAVMATAPRWYITAGELSSTPSYMRGRLTLDKVSWRWSVVPSLCSGPLQQLYK